MEASVSPLWRARRESKRVVMSAIPPVSPIPPLEDISDTSNLQLILLDFWKGMFSLTKDYTNVRHLLPGALFPFSYSSHIAGAIYKGLHSSTCNLLVWVCLEGFVRNALVVVRDILRS